MSPLRIVGIVFLVVGVVLFMVGNNSSNSIADQFHHAVTGRYTDTTNWYMIAGISTGVVGLVLLIFGGGKKA